jgi:hypothetical protein
MRSSPRSWYLRLAAAVLALAFASAAHAETPREEIAHAYILLAHADADYAGHRANAMKLLSAVGKDLGLHLQGDAPEAERQWKSDRKLLEARRLLREARDKLELEDRNRAATRMDRAVRELDAALRTN